MCTHVCTILQFIYIYILACEGLTYEVVLAVVYIIYMYVDTLVRYLQHCVGAVTVVH